MTWKGRRKSSLGSEADVLNYAALRALGLRELAPAD
jgi:hypothetical protein